MTGTKSGPFGAVPSFRPCSLDENGQVRPSSPQLMHLDILPASPMLIVPGIQPQSSALGRPSPKVVVPATHGMHCFWPLRSWYSPMTQRRHAVCPGKSWPYLQTGSKGICFFEKIFSGRRNSGVSSLEIQKILPGAGHWPHLVVASRAGDLKTPPKKVAFWMLFGREMGILY